MEDARFLDALSADFDRLRFVAPLDPAAPVPTCPGWNVGQLTWHVANWGSYFTDLLSSASACTYVLRTDEAAWRVQTTPGELSVDDVPADDSTPADVTISGPPMDLLRWVWNRDGPDPSQVTVDGPEAAVTLLRRCIATATQ
jgi:hypothetical protein